jgi:flagellar motility protein MotE (MotC chaperone)
MGFTFRDGNYQRRVYFGKRTIKQGECAMIWSLSGNCEKVYGPRLKRLWFSTIRFCTRFSANERQFLIVKFKDGHTEYIPGPITMYQDHILHQEILVRNALTVNRGEAIAVLTVNDNVEGKSGSNKMVETITEGPLLFFPTIKQTVREFNFDDETKKNGKVVYSGVRPKYQDMFSRRKVIISLLEQNTVIERAYRSIDNYNFVLKLSLNWKVADVAKLLNNTDNPVKVLKNSLINDLTHFVQQKNYENLINSPNVFNVSMAATTKHTNANKVGMQSTDIYSLLFQQAKNIGVEICSVAYQGITIDSAYEHKCEEIENDKRQEKYLREKDAEEERREDFKLNMALARADKQTKKEFADMEHRQKLLDEAHKAKLKREQETFVQNLQQEKSRLLLKAEFYKSLQTNGVDLTKYLVAKVSAKKQHGNDGTIVSERKLLDDKLVASNETCAPPEFEE